MKLPMISETILYQGLGSTLWMCNVLSVLIPLKPFESGTGIVHI